MALQVRGPHDWLSLGIPSNNECNKTLRDGARETWKGSCSIDSGWSACQRDGPKWRLGPSCAEQITGSSRSDVMVSFWMVFPEPQKGFPFLEGVPLLLGSLYNPNALKNKDPPTYQVPLWRWPKSSRRLAEACIGAHPLSRVRTISITLVEDHSLIPLGHVSYLSECKVQKRNF